MVNSFPGYPSRLASPLPPTTVLLYAPTFTTGPRANSAEPSNAPHSSSRDKLVHIHTPSLTDRGPLSRNHARILACPTRHSLCSRRKTGCMKSLSHYIKFLRTWPNDVTKLACMHASPAHLTASILCCRFRGFAHNKHKCSCLHSCTGFTECGHLQNQQFTMQCCPPRLHVTI